MNTEEKDVFDSMNMLMRQSLEKLASNFSSIRSGRASSAMLENTMVTAYQQKMPLKDMASLTTNDANSLSVQVWDIANVKTVEKAIYAQDQSLTLRIEGNTLYVSFPAINKERRLLFVKQAQEKTESTKVVMRNVRRSLNETLKKQLKDKTLSEDDYKKLLKESQSITDAYHKKAEESLAKKTKDIMQI